MRVYRWLLHLFPASFRRTYGDEMAAIFARRRREARGLALPVLWCTTIADTVVNAWAEHVDVLRHDLTSAVRSLRRAPGFAVATVLVAALGIGATTTAVSVTDHVLVRPLPFPESDRIVRLWQDQSARGYPFMELSPPNFRDWKARARSFASIAAFTSVAANLVGEGEPERVAGADVTGDFFRVFETAPFIGRPLVPPDDEAGAPGTVVLSYRLWVTRFGSDTNVVGRTIILDDERCAVVGVMPATFMFPSRETQFWRPIRLTPSAFDEADDWTNNYLHGVARLAAGVAVDGARAESRVIAAQLEREHPTENAKTSANVVRLRDQVSERTRLLLIVLLGAAVCLLLLACSNLAHMALTRALSREQELSVRVALGAGRERLVRQMTTEHALLSGLGGLLGVVVAVASSPLVSRLVPTSLPIADTPGVDLRLLLASLVATLATGIGFGVLPALRISQRTSAMGLAQGARTGTSRRTERVRAVLVVTEVAATIVLVVVAGLLVRALWRIQSVDPGFRTTGVLTLRTALPIPKYQATEAREAFYRRVLSGVRALPSVTSAAYISFLPMVMRGGVWPVSVPGEAAPAGESKTASLRYVTPDFFPTLGIPLREGRDVRESDTQDAPYVAVVSESFVRQHWPDGDAIGRELTMAFDTRIVVGVVADVRVRGLEQVAEPQVYVPSAQVADGSIVAYTPKDLVVASTGDPRRLVPDVRRIIAEADPLQPISDVRSLAEVVDAETAPRQVQVRVLSAFALIAFVLAGVGLHGLLAFTVSRRTREIGLRLALGATRADIVTMLLGRVTRLALIGTVVGGLLANVASRSLGSILVGVSPGDLPTLFAAVAAVLALVSGGSLLPALRAVRVDPLVAIRSE
ncbi:MAG: ABC transporter permease [Vicinamibacterales bacterium]